MCTMIDGYSTILTFCAQSYLHFRFDINSHIPTISSNEKLFFNVIKEYWCFPFISVYFLLLDLLFACGLVVHNVPHSMKSQKQISFLGSNKRKKRFYMFKLCFQNCNFYNNRISALGENGKKWWNELSCILYIYDIGWCNYNIWLKVKNLENGWCDGTLYSLNMFYVYLYFVHFTKIM